MRKWIARFSFSLLIIGGVLLYQAYELQNSAPRPPAWELVVIVAGGTLALAMGVQGMRMRHQNMRSDQDMRNEP